MKDKQGLFIRKGKYEILKGDLRQLDTVLFDVIMSEISRKLGSTRLSDTTMQDIQDRLSCVFECIDLDTYLNDIKVQEGYDLVMKLAPSVGLQYCKENNKIVLVKGYEFCDINSIVLDYTIFCKDVKELLQMNSALLTELTKNGIVEIFKSGNKYITAKGLEVKAIPRGMISLLRYNIIFSDIVLYDARVSKYFATIVQNEKSIKVVDRIDRRVSLKNFSTIEDTNFGLSNFMKSSVKGYGNFIELRNGCFDFNVIKSLRCMSCNEIRFKDKYNILHLDLSIVRGGVKVKKFIDLIYKYIYILNILKIFI